MSAADRMFDAVEPGVAQLEPLRSATLPEPRAGTWSLIRSDIVAVGPGSALRVRRRVEQDFSEKRRFGSRGWQEADWKIGSFRRGACRATSTLLALALAAALPAAVVGGVPQYHAPGSNPIIRDRFTADPAPLVVGDRLYLYVGHDEARGDEMFNMREWLVYSTSDMRHWTDHGPIMKVTDFRWAKKDAWASQVIRKKGRYWLYAAVEHDDTHPGKAIAVAVSDKPTGPFVDAKGSALITNAMTPKGTHSWEDIDPTVFTDDDGTSWIAWGNRQCYIARLKPNMIEIDGPITDITPPHFEEGPWLHKRGKLYYLTYASLDRSRHSDERVSYSTAPSIKGPWTYRGELTGSGKNSFTIHPGIARFKGKWYLFLHNAALTVGDQKGALGRRAVTVEHLRYNRDGTLKPVVQTDAGVSAPLRR